jgi:ABC-type uncharacterized transport system permease subunit
MEIQEKIRLRRASLMRQLLITFLAVILAFIIGAVILVLSGTNPLLAYKALFLGSFGNLYHFSETLVSSTPLIFTGLAIAFAFRCGLFNIGVEGQLIMGSLAAGYVGYAIVGLPRLIHLPLVILVGSLVGGLWAAVPGFLKGKLGIHEVITSIMMNYIALYLAQYFVEGPLKVPGNNSSLPFILGTAQLAKIPNMFRLHTGLFIALVVAFLIYILLWKTIRGYEIRAVGSNQFAAQYGGISVSKNIILAMFISGVLAGLAGAVQVAGVNLAFFSPFGFSGYGFDGIAVALMGNNHPVGIVLSAILFGGLAHGSMLMQSQAEVSKQIIGVVQATIIFFIAADGIISSLLDWRRKGGVKHGSQ